MADGSVRKRSVNLTIREDVIESAKSLGLNASQAAEAGIAEAVRRAREKEWLEQARPAIEAYNERIAREGPLIVTEWAKLYWTKAK